MSAHWLIAVIMHAATVLSVPDDPKQPPSYEQRAQVVAVVTQTFASKAACDSGAVALKKIADAGNFLVLGTCAPLDVAKLTVTEPPRKWPDARAPR